MHFLEVLDNPTVIIYPWGFNISDLKEIVGHQVYSIFKYCVLVTLYDTSCVVTGQ